MFISGYANTENDFYCFNIDNKLVGESTFLRTKSVFGKWIKVEPCRYWRFEDTNKYEIQLQVFVRVLKKDILLFFHQKVSSVIYSEGG